MTNRIQRTCGLLGFSFLLIGAGGRAAAQHTTPAKPLIDGSTWFDVRHQQLTLSEFEKGHFAPWFGIPASDVWRLVERKSQLTGLVDLHYEQWCQGVRIENAELRVHTDEEDHVLSLNGTRLLTHAVLTPRLSRADCENIAVTLVMTEIGPRELSPPTVMHPSSDRDSGLVYVQEDASEALKDPPLALCYRIHVQSHLAGYVRTIYVDALNGRIVRSTSAHRGNCNDGSALTLFYGWRTIKTRWRAFPHFDYVTEDQCRGDGILSWDVGLILLDDADNQWSLYEERPITTALWSGEMTYDYWMNVHSRNSWDGNGGLVRIRARDNYFGSDGAAWNEANETIYCGTGGGDQFQYAYVGLDAIGHEFLHAISSPECGWSSGSGWETRSLDEGFADVFGVMVDFYANSSANYLVAEQNGYPGGFRNLANPNYSSQPDTYEGDFWSYSADESAAYTNMSIASHWFYLLAEGGTGTNDHGFDYDVSGIGRSSAERILWRAMHAYLGPTSSFPDAKNATIYSAIDIFGICSWEALQTVNAWNAVGVESSLGMGAQVVLDCGPLIAQHNAQIAAVRLSIDNLSANCALSANATPVDFFAGESISLMPGFSSGDRFLAMIDPCTAQARVAIVPPGSPENSNNESRPVHPGLGIVRDQFTIAVFPNPSKDKALIRLSGSSFIPEEPWSLEVIDPLGKLVLATELMGSLQSIDLEAHKGLFLLRVYQGEHIAMQQLLLE